MIAKTSCVLSLLITRFSLGKSLPQIAKEEPTWLM